MNKRYLRKNDEGYYEYGLRLIEIKCKENPNDLDWEDILELLDYKIHRDSLRKACNTTMFSSYNVMQYYKDKYEVDNKKLKEIRFLLSLSIFYYISLFTRQLQTI